ncbi:DUF1697 domain-containing protein [Isoptericola sp. 178]|uniref:DUF1697 domain-containing protein n=1 Tax=Isoptericola sp. 178 TaxID=3064651 RepID=UPI0027141DFC|nr:DUF1697 domain-containing protein [Isoptericola sp. 178]MDO8144273.1 DUF1697 domain-containing protein [Isoptericola sp. 178]
MTSFVVLLRGVNIGSNRRVGAADLRAAASAAGLTGARTYATSGNLVATADGGDAEDVAARTANALAAALGTEVPLLALSAARLAHLVAANPFPDAARDDPSHLQLHVGPTAVDEEGVARLAADHDGPERLATRGGALFVHYPAGIGRSRLTSARLDRATGTWTTGRNWRTVLRMEAMRDGSA